MKKLIAGLVVLMSVSANAADFTISLVPVQHNHEISEVNGLSSALGAKANSSSLGSLAAKSSVSNADITDVAAAKISGFTAAVNAVVDSVFVKKSEILVPTVQRFIYTDGLAKTYTTPVGVKYIRVSVVGGGGGGAGAGQNSNAGSGGESYFGASLSALGGAGGNYYAQGGAGGTATVLAPAIPVLVGRGNAGGGGGGGGGQMYTAEGEGGGSPFLGGGGTGGSPGAAGTGGGGSGAGSDNRGGAGSGAGGGGGLIAIIPSPAATYSYKVGAGGIAGTGPFANGAAGGSGIIVVEEFYQ